MPVVLRYFNGRGVIEVARYMLHIGGADWEDFRYPIDMQSKAKYEHAAADKVGFFISRMQTHFMTQVHTTKMRERQAGSLTGRNHDFLVLTALGNIKTQV